MSHALAMEVMAIVFGMGMFKFINLEETISFCFEDIVHMGLSYKFALVYNSANKEIMLLNIRRKVIGKCTIKHIYLCKATEAI
jgi:hypothetical protein